MAVRTLLSLFLIGSLCLTALGGRTTLVASNSSVAYIVTDLNVNSKEISSEAYAINNRGAVVGKLFASSDSSRILIEHCLWSKGKRISFPDFKQPRSQAYAINDYGDLAGLTGIGDSKSVPFLWSHGKITYLSNKITYLSNNDGEAYGLNNKDEVVGVVRSQKVDTQGVLDISERAFVWRKGKMILLGTFGGDTNTAYGINDRSEVVGKALAANGASKPFVWREGKMSALKIGKAKAGHARAINNRGDIVGAILQADGQDHAVLWQRGKLLSLGVLPGGYASRAWSINNRGEVVGYSNLPHGVTHAFLWRQDKIIDLNSLIPADSGWELVWAEGINDRGQIVGLGKYQGQERAFLLTPKK